MYIHNKINLLVPISHITELIATERIKKTDDLI